MMLLRATLTAALLTLTSVAAQAVPATTRGPVRLYDGPSPNFQVVAVIPPNTDVDVVGCSAGWCQVLADEGEGFARDRQLDFDQEPPVVVFPPLVYQFGWSNWQRRYPDEWERWHQRYRRRDQERRPQRRQPPGPERLAPNDRQQMPPLGAPPGLPPQVPGGLMPAPPLR